MAPHAALQPRRPGSVWSPSSPLCWSNRRRRSGTAAPSAPPAYVFTYFTKNGEDGLHLAWSADGYRWEKLNGGRAT